MNRKFLGVFAAAVLVMAALPGGIALAGETKTYTVGVEDLDYFPVYAVQRGQYVGYARDILDAFAKERGYHFEYKPFPINRLFATFFQGQVDFKFPDNPNWQGDMRAGKKIIYSTPVIAYIDGTLVRPELKDAGPDKIHTLGTVAGFTPWAWMDQIKSKQVILRENANFTALAQQVVAKRMDAAYASVAVVNYQLDNVLKTPGTLVFNSKLPHSKDNYFLSTLQHPEVIGEFDAWQKSHQDFLRGLKKKYGVEKGVND
ncbi:MAG: transporter substrate-binding domain-containing protein [Sulfuricella sp.]|nr:transporter substrate-binding domain-containing protein [Sulfuricella sp.]